MAQAASSTIVSAVLGGQRQEAVDVRGQPELVDEHDGAGPGGDALSYVGQVEVERVRARLRRRRAGRRRGATALAVAMNDIEGTIDLVARPDARGDEGQVQGGGARRDRDGVRGAAVVRELAFSNASTRGPWVTQPDSMTSRIAIHSGSPISGRAIGMRGLTTRSQ